MFGDTTAIQAPGTAWTAELAGRLNAGDAAEARQAITARLGGMYQDFMVAVTPNTAPGMIARGADHIVSARGRLKVQGQLLGVQQALLNAMIAAQFDNLSILREPVTAGYLGVGDEQVAPPLDSYAPPPEDAGILGTAGEFYYDALLVPLGAAADATAQQKSLLLLAAGAGAFLFVWSITRK